ncbi:protein spaetzle 4 [Tetranychus urticae]|nr:protein spaetzle 4 [Tetranychus urticae]
MNIIFNLHCSIFLTLSVFANAGDYKLNRASEQSAIPINSELNNNHLKGRYVSNVGSYRFTPDDVAVKAYRNLYYKNHQAINRIKPSVMVPLVKGNRNLRNGVSNLLLTAPSSSVSTKMSPSASTTSTSSLPPTSSHLSSTSVILTSTEKPTIDQIVDPLIPIEGRSVDQITSRVKAPAKHPESFQDLMSNVTIFPSGDKIMKDIYNDNVFNNQERQEQLKQMSKWMSSSPSTDTRSGPMYSLTGRNHNLHSNLLNDSLPIEKITIIPKPSNNTSDINNKGRRSKNNKTSNQHETINKPEALVLSPSPSLKPSSGSSTGSPLPTAAASTSSKSDNNVLASEDDEAALMDDEDGPQSGSESAGTLKTPPCGKNGRHYCIFREDYPTKVVTEVARYYKWPLEKLFRDLRNQVMPKLANDNYGGLVCDSITRVVRPGWARNTNNRWLVVINTDAYQQYVTEVLCRHGSGSYCNFIPPCYHATCRQRYNTQKLLVIDPWNPYKGPFLSEFLFPSCCICHVSDESLSPPRKGVSVRPDGRTKSDLSGPHRSGIVQDSSTEKNEL